MRPPLFLLFACLAFARADPLEPDFEAEDVHALPDDFKLADSPSLLLGDIRTTPGPGILGPLDIRNFPGLLDIPSTPGPQLEAIPITPKQAIPITPANALQKPSKITPAKKIPVQDINQDIPIAPESRPPPSP
jgi:hypothetical protein